MKKISLILAAVIAAGSMTMFTGCGKSAREKLNPTEGVIYDAFLEGLDNFYNPQTVKILECSSVYSLGDTQNPYFITANEVAHCYIKVNAQTKSGGSASEVYCLVTDKDSSSKYKAGSMWTWDDVIDSLESMGYNDQTIRSLGFSKNSDYYVSEDKDIDVGKLNKALDEHFEEKGLK